MKYYRDSEHSHQTFAVSPNVLLLFTIIGQRGQKVFSLQFVAPPPSIPLAALLLAVVNV